MHTVAELLDEAKDRYEASSRDAAFWRDTAASGAPCKERKHKRQNDYPTDTRCAFVDYVDALQKSGEISEALAARATL